MGFELLRFEILVEPKNYYRNGDRVNSMLIIELVGHLKCKHILMTAIGVIACLPSFKVKYGGVCYYVEAIIDSQLLYDKNSNAKQEFIVKTHSNVCPSRIDCRSVASVQEKLFRMFGIKTGAVRLSAHLDRNVYCCGEVISIHYHLDNRSSNTICFLPQLVRRTVFKMEDMFRDINERIDTNDGDKCTPNCSQSDIVCIPIYKGFEDSGAENHSLHVNSG
ncbi:unnamed protein product [Medioppia subpectinata]|uniref:Arrestin C-terminal-like domain-containing protein n=1 Tax=Medioppia subpectinata TaxID=1979941 RepID=A0A7R9KWS9_9ACAR|nr:unnamed protein product [Medioppia subpectinata]CAG2111092.1 unnamed protein product [Medioppia subpectinata]